MEWKKRDLSKTIEDVIERNTGKKIEVFTDLSKKYTIKNIKKVVSMILDAVSKNIKITIVGDYDADGIDAAAILKMAIESIGGNVTVRLPRRITEGFGLSEKIVDEIDTGLLITVDNGIAAVEPIKKAKAKGLTVIVTDHHLPNEDGILPDADIIIDPNAIPESADFSGYCGAGIAFKIAEELIPKNDKLLKKLSCFAAIGTIADVMELVEDNRRIVIEGLKNMVHFGSRTTGLASILKSCELSEHITAHDVAFKIGPMINAPGRLFDDGAKISLDALTYNSSYKDSIGQEMFEINEQRKKTVANAYKDIMNNIAENCLYGDYPYVIYQPNLPEGIVGILAGRIAEDLSSPCIIFTDSHEEGIYKGSARSHGGVHLKNLLDKCSDDIYKYGGHAEAAGISVLAENFDKLKENLQEYIDDPVEEENTDTVYYDLEITQSELKDVFQKLQKYEPFGNGNEQIVFKVTDYKLSPRQSSWYKTLGEDNSHLKLFGINSSVIAFGQAEKYTIMKTPHNLEVIGTISKSYFRNFSEIQVEAVDFKDSSKKIAKTKLSSALQEIARTRYE